MTLWKQTINLLKSICTINYGYNQIAADVTGVERLQQKPYLQGASLINRGKWQITTVVFLFKLRIQWMQDGATMSAWEGAGAPQFH